MKKFFEGFEDFGSAYDLYYFALNGVNDRIAYLKNRINSGSLSVSEEINTKSYLDYLLHFRDQIEIRLRKLFPVFLKDTGANGA